MVGKRKFISRQNFKRAALFLICSLFVIAPYLAFKKAENFRENSEPFKICAVIEKKFLREGNSWNGRLQSSKPIVIFKKDEYGCKYFPQMHEWAGLEPDKSYLIEGRSTSSLCKVDKVIESCELPSNEAGIAFK